MKWYTYLICFVLIIFGGFFGIRFYNEIRAESYINGSIDVTNKFTQESFSYYSTSLLFYEDGNNYSFEIDLLKVEDFDGEENKYQVVLNDYVLINSDINAGSIYSNLQIDFYDTENNLVHSSNLDISIRFYSDKTSLTISTNGQESASYLEKYFSDNGVRLSVNKIL